jgi:dihydrofolate reductase
MEPNMGKIVLTTNTSLDGVVQDPDGKEGWPLGGWFDRALGKDREAWASMFAAEAMRTDALLLGRRTDAWFGTRWNPRTGTWAERLNRLPKYVVSSTLAQATWSNGVVVKGDLATAVAELKREVRGEIAIYASYQLVRALMALDLIDEVRLVVFPVVVGAGVRLFGEDGGKNPLRMVGARPLGEGLAMLTYASTRGD